MNKRYRRLRRTPAIRDLVRETTLTSNDVIQPYFVIDGNGVSQDIASMPGIARLSVDLLARDVESFVGKGGKAVLLFGVPDKKDDQGKEAVSEKGIVPRAVKELKKHFPDLVVMTDVCLCSYMDHGHCGIVRDNAVDNDATLELLQQMSLTHARAGADVVSPSDMMDLRVKAIREALDKDGFIQTAIMSYAVKYASAFYGPFRDAAHSTPGFGDRKSYQMDPANRREALKEARQDVEEGADIIMVKPAVAYLDILSDLRADILTPLAAYHVSGEYAMIKAAAAKGWVSEKDIVLETLTSIKRAGADLIITYTAQDLLSWLK